MSVRRLLRVAIPVPRSEPFDYYWDDGLPLPEPGTRVRVPFARSDRIGLVLGHPERSSVDSARLKPVTARLDSEPLLEADLLNFVLWSAAYYRCSAGEAVFHALPALLRRGRPLGTAPALAWTISAAGRGIDVTQLAKRAPRQAEALTELRRLGIASRDELSRAGIGAAVLKRLSDSALIEQTERPNLPTSSRTSVDWPTLTDSQAAAVDSVLAADNGFSAHLLYGVTGSGKTEVYFHVIRQMLSEGLRSLLLVPEIGLTPQLIFRLEERFGPLVAALHSRLSAAERLAAWRRAHNGEARLVVGTRSAVFASIPNLGLIVVDEEHDVSFKQQTGFRYSARDLAVARARGIGAKVILGSATPSLESYQNARIGKYRLLELPERIGKGGAPQLRIVDLNKHASDRQLSTPLIERISRHLADANQVILFLNRRGFAPVLFCPSCERTQDCDRCDAHLTIHARAGKLRCHHCGAENPLRWRCNDCGAERVAVGAGTQRVDDALAALYPQHEITRLDRDSTRRKGALDSALARAASGDSQILVGTQMLTKGHDFPSVTLVGVLNADQGLFGTDFRSAERLAQTIIQVAGRAGRRDRIGEVVIQTHFPRHPLLQRLIDDGYTGFAELALNERHASGWPPFSHLAVIRAEGPNKREVHDFLQTLKSTAAPSTSEVTLLGPAADSMERKAGHYCAHLMLRSNTRRPLHELLKCLDEVIRGAPIARRLRCSIDVDPVEV